MSEWQPIETAPAGVEVLVFLPVSDRYSRLGLGHKRSDSDDEITTAIMDASRRSLCWSYSRCGEAYDRDDYFGDHVNPTHWMPMPERPLDRLEAERSV